jgi:RND family efflux transporter MFP subunit
MKVRFPISILWGATALVAVGAAALMVLGDARATPEAATAPAPALTVQLAQPRLQSLPRHIDAHGTVMAWQEASIGSEANGLRLAAVHVNVGDAVRRGQLLASFERETVEADLAQIEAAVGEAKAHAAEAAANAERARGLASSGALSEQQVQQFLTAEQTALARLEAQRAAARGQRLRLAKTQVLAPDDGVISARSATEGAVVPAGQELFRLIRGGRLEWRAEVTPQEAARLQPGSAVSVQGADGGSVAGRVRQVGPTIDARNRTALVYVDLPRSPQLKAGLFAQGSFDLGASPALTIPQQALVLRDGFSYVFTLAEAQRVRQQKVRTGRQLADGIEVLEGLAPQTRFVAGGAGFLNDGDLVKVVTR